MNQPGDTLLPCGMYDEPLVKGRRGDTRRAGNRVRVRGDLMEIRHHIGESRYAAFAHRLEDLIHARKG